MLKYKGKELIFQAEKTGGKIQGSINGFYKDSENNEYFIKNPSNKGELFAEAFAGALLQEMMIEGFIPELYRSSFIVAEPLQIQSGEYALIQPKVAFKELFRIIGTGYSDNSDRSPLYETIWGPLSYKKINELQNRSGLSISLMISILLSAHSVHSGNIVILENNNQDSHCFARIDWGDSFRNLNDPKNQELLYASENRSYFNHKRYTKDFILNYKLVPGIYNKMAARGASLKEKLQVDSFEKLITAALQKLPPDLINEVTQTQFADYIYIPSFKEVKLGNTSTYKNFAKDMANILEKRLDAMTHLQDLQEPKDGNLYESMIQVDSNHLKLSSHLKFNELVGYWKTLFFDQQSTINFKEIDLESLTNKFHDYLDQLIESCEQSGAWADSRNTRQNIFVKDSVDNIEVKHGHAFVPHYKEKTIFKNLYCFKGGAHGSARFASYESAVTNYQKSQPNSLWSYLEELATMGQNVINQLRLIINTNCQDEINPTSFQQSLELFLEAQKLLEQAFNNASIYLTNEENESEFFYPIKDEELANMSAEQLVTICLEELNTSMASPTPLIKRIIEKDELWDKMHSKLYDSCFEGRDNIEQKREAIRQFREKDITNSKNLRTIKQLEKELSDIQAENLNLTNKVKASGKLVEELRQVNKKLEADIDSLKNINRNLDKKADSLTEQPKKLTNQSELDKEKLANIENNLDKLIDQAQEANSNLKELQKYADDEIQQHKTQKDTQVKQLSAQISSFPEQQTKDKEVIKNLRAELETQKNNFDRQLKDELSKAAITLERTKLISPLSLYINQVIFEKANDLRKRNETTACQAIDELIIKMNNLLDEYTTSPDDNDLALKTFKERSLKVIKEAEKNGNLNNHREIWKPILGNLGLFFVLLGVGYVGAAIINFCVNDKFTFFHNKTKTQCMVDELENMNKNLGNK